MEDLKKRKAGYFMRQFNRILFVAESGTCREPMAAGILSEYTLKHPATIESRGLVVLFFHTIIRGRFYGGYAGTGDGAYTVGKNSGEIRKCHTGESFCINRAGRRRAGDTGSVRRNAAVVRAVL